jgi:hypothetical protein
MCLNMKVLFGVFHWGLGHVTRDSVLINEFLDKKNEVHIISTGRSMKLLKKIYKNKCKFFDVLSVSPPNIRYGAFGVNFLLNLPKMYLDIKKARAITQKIIEKEKYDVVISDCRFDVYDRLDNSYLINHHFGFKFFMDEPESIEYLEKKSESNLWKYKYVLVPDFKENKGLSGKLSHRLKFLDKSKIKYMGILSHVKKKNIKKDIDFFISISAPEPGRTILEKKFLGIVNMLPGKIVVALGKPESKNVKEGKKVSVYSYLN